MEYRGLVLGKRLYYMVVVLAFISSNHSLQINHVLNVSDFHAAKYTKTRKDSKRKGGEIGACHAASSFAFDNLKSTTES